MVVRRQEVCRIVRRVLVFGLMAPVFAFVARALLILMKHVRNVER
jgi:hypothetical protein